MLTTAQTNRDWVGGSTIFKLALPVWYDNILLSLNEEERTAVECFVDNRDDDRIWNIAEFLNELMFRGPMLAMADAHTGAGGKTFVYYWSFPSSLPERGACHAVELAFVLNNPQESIYTGGNFNSALAAEVQQMWVNFAVSGDPSTNSHKFPRYDSRERQVMRLDTVIRPESDMLHEQRVVVAPLIPRFISPLYSNMSLNVPTIWRYVAYLVLTVLLVILLVVGLWKRRKRLLPVLLLGLAISANAEEPADTTESYDFWQHVYFPLEAGISLSPDSHQKHAFYISTSLEYRIHRTRGWFFVIEYDEHTHEYNCPDLTVTNATVGDAQYMDILVGAGWRHPVHRKWSLTALLQGGTTWSHLKHVVPAVGSTYHLIGHNRWVPAVKTTMGLEYVFNADFNLFLNVGYVNHLKPVQLEVDRRRTGVIDVSVGFSCNLF